MRVNGKVARRTTENAAAAASALCSAGTEGARQSSATMRDARSLRAGAVREQSASASVRHPRSYSVTGAAIDGCERKKE